MRGRFLYLLERVGEHVGTDEYDGHVIRARSADEARTLAPCADEGSIWTDRERTTVRCIGRTDVGSSGVILSSFRAG